MDQIHEIDKKPWISSLKPKVEDLVFERGRLLQENHVKLDGQASQSDKTSKQDEEQRKNLNKRIEEFVAKNEDQVRSYFLFNSTDERVLVDDPECKLSMCKLQLEHAKRMISDRGYKVNYLSRLRTRRKEILTRHLAAIDREEQRKERRDLEGTNESSDDNSLTVILVVQTWPQPKKTEKLRLSKEILFKSDQCLTDLRDHLKCQHDSRVPIDMSHNPRQSDEEHMSRGHLFKSGFFLIEDTFYNDMRDVNNTDLSARIIEWADQQVSAVDAENRNVRIPRGIGPFKRANMEHTKFADLTIRLGRPYLYLHQGNCEHLFTVSDIRYIQSGTRLDKLHFPCVTFAAHDRREDFLKCYMCRQRPPRWFTRNNDRLPTDPFFFCEACFMSFNYDDNMKKIGNFQAFLYTCTSCGQESSVAGSSVPALT